MWRKYITKKVSHKVYSTLTFTTKNQHECESNAYAFTGQAIITR